MKKSIVYLSLIFMVLLVCVGVLFFVMYPINYKDIVEKYSKQYGLSTELVYSVINVESSFDKNALSSAGAMGLMQIMPATASEVAKKLNLKNFEVTQLYNPETNIQIGCYYLRYLLDMFNQDQTKALCAYNAGYNNVISWLSTNGTLNKIPFSQTENYVKKVARNINVYKYIY